MFLKLPAFLLSFQHFMADASLNLKRKKRGSNSSTSDNELRSPEEKKARDKPLNVELASSAVDKVPEQVEMTHDLGAKVDLILSSLDAVDSKVESINAVCRTETEQGTGQSRNARTRSGQVEGRH